MTGMSAKSPMSGRRPRWGGIRLGRGLRRRRVAGGVAGSAGARRGWVGAIGGDLRAGGGPAAPARLGLDGHQQGVLADALADGDLELLDGAGDGGGDLHGRLVALQRQQRLFRLDACPRGPPGSR
jgi:hypothetical protein